MPIGVAEGATLACGGRPVREGELDRGYYFAPTIFAGALPDARIAQEEIFGPVTTVIPVAGIEEAVAANNGVRYGLSSSIYTRDVNRAFRAIDRLDTGIVYVNHGTTGAEIQLDTYTEWKSVYIDYSGRLQRA